MDITTPPTATTQLVDTLPIVLPTVGLIAVSVVSLAKETLQAKKIRKLKKQIRKLTEITLTLKDGIYYNDKNYPFCPVCFGKDRYAIPLHALPATEQNGASLVCQHCKFHVLTPACPPSSC